MTTSNPKRFSPLRLKDAYEQAFQTLGCHPDELSGNDNLCKQLSLALADLGYDVPSDQVIAKYYAKPKKPARKKSKISPPVDRSPIKRRRRR